MIDAIEVLKKYINTHRRSYPTEENIPIDGVVPQKWEAAVVLVNQDGSQQINCINYEVCVLYALRVNLCNRTIWVEGADRYRNPDEDTLVDFHERRETYYGALKQPLDPNTFTSQIQAQMDEELNLLNDTLPDNPYVEILPRGGGWIKLSPLPKQIEPPQLTFLKEEIARLWPMTSLLVSSQSSSVG